VVIPVEDDLEKQSPFYNYKSGFHQTSNPNWAPKIHLTHRGEKLVTNVFFDSVTIQAYQQLKETPKFRRTHTGELTARHYAWGHPRGSAKPDPKEGYDILVAALGLGMVDEAAACADELLALAQNAKDGLRPDVAAFVRAYGALQPALKAGPTKRGNTDYWQRKLGAKGLNTSPHYAVLYWDATEDEVRRRVTILEENFKAFYLLNAVRGVELPVPDAPLVAVLPKQGRDVLALDRALDGPSRLPADGFYSPEHDVLVLSPERLDSLGLTLNAQIQQMYHEVSRKDLLAGKGPKIDTDGKINPNTNKPYARPHEVARMQTLALVERLVDESATTCAISREGTMQLLYATGQLPRFVSLPEWFSNGAANFYTRPKDATFVKDGEGKWWMTVCPETGYGLPNYVLQRQFADIYAPLLEEKRDAKARKEQSSERGTLLRNVLADAYFQGLRDPQNVNDPDPAKLDKSGIALMTGKGPNTAPGFAAGGPPGFFPGGGGRPPRGGGVPPGGGSSLGPPPGMGSSLGPPGPGGAVGPGGEGGPQPVTAVADNDPLVILRKKREQLSVKAQATSWALYYYLAKDRPSELRKFVSELSTLPRDLPLDGPTVTAAFCRSFGLDGSPESFARFADTWMDYTRSVARAGIDIPLVEPKAPKNDGATGGPPGGMPPGLGSAGPPPGGP
jgi:hypothetical protein